MLILSIDTVVQCFSNFNVCGNHLADLIKNADSGSAPGLGWSLRFSTSNKLVDIILLDYRPHFEEQGCS